MPSPSKTYCELRKAARIELNAAFENYDTQARLPVYEKLRLGIAAGPLICKTADNYRATFTPYPEAPFDWGKVRGDKQIHAFSETTIPVRAENLPEGYLGPASMPTQWKRAYTTKEDKPLPIKKGDKCLFIEPPYRGYFNTMEVLASFPASETWPCGKAKKATLSATASHPENPSDERAMEACLDESIPILLIKGPPGTGKTDLLAQAALALAADGKKVGIVSVSHKVVDNALQRVVQVARTEMKAGALPPSIQKHKNIGTLEGVLVRPLAGGGELPQIWGAVMAAAMRFYKTEIENKKQKRILPEFAFGECDVLLFDEAGQMPAYDAAALSKLAKRLIFFGDEDQLPNISHGSHAPGSHGDSSAMRYLRDTLPEQLCIALETSHRMNTDICGLIQRHFYPRIPLKAGINAETHLLEGMDRIPSLVLDRFTHKTPSLSRSNEEATRVADWAKRLLKMQVKLGDKNPRKMTTKDIAILTPFRAHVSAIKQALSQASIANAHEITVGTVDAMQGQDAAVVIYSMASSSNDYIAKQIEWLLSPNRWNVAISRAKACAIVVGDVGAHLNCTPRALNGISAQTKIRELMKDAQWETSVPIQCDDSSPRIEEEPTALPRDRAVEKTNRLKPRKKLWESDSPSKKIQTETFLQKLHFRVANGFHSIEKGHDPIRKVVNLILSGEGEKITIDSNRKCAYGCGQIQFEDDEGERRHWFLLKEHLQEVFTSFYGDDPLSQEFQEMFQLKSPLQISAEEDLEKEVVYPSWMLKEDEPSETEIHEDQPDEDDSSSLDRPIITVIESKMKNGVLKWKAQILNGKALEVGTICKPLPEDISAGKQYHATITSTQPFNYQFSKITPIREETSSHHVHNP